MTATNNNQHDADQPELDEASQNSKKLETRRRIEELFEEKRLRDELGLEI